MIYLTYTFAVEDEDVATTREKLEEFVESETNGNKVQGAYFYGGYVGRPVFVTDEKYDSLELGASGDLAIPRDADHS